MTSRTCSRSRRAHPSPADGLSPAASHSSRRSSAGALPHRARAGTNQPQPTGSPSLLPQPGRRGTEKVMLNLAAGLAARDHAVDPLPAKADGRFPGSGGAGGSAGQPGGRPGVAECAPPWVRYLRETPPRVLLSAMEHANLVGLWSRRLSVSVPWRRCAWRFRRNSWFLSEAGGGWCCGWHGGRTGRPMPWSRSPRGVAGDLLPARSDTPPTGST